MQLSENPKECQANRAVVTQRFCSWSCHQLLAAPYCAWLIPNLLPSAEWKGWLVSLALHCIPVLGFKADLMPSHRHWAKTPCIGAVGAFRAVGTW